MSDNVATHRRRHVADPLREFADRHADKLGAAIVGDTQTAESSAWHYLYRLADQIDREHERRMEQCRHTTCARRSVAIWAAWSTTTGTE